MNFLITKTYSETFYNRVFYGIAVWKGLFDVEEP